MRKILIGILLGLLLAGIVYFLVSKGKNSGETKTSETYLITNQIKNLNKMVVVEQDFSFMEKTKYSYKVLGNEVSNSSLLTITNTKTQLSYDLSQMKYELDTVNKKLTFTQLPSPQFQIIPSVEIAGVDDSFINRIKEEDIKSVTESAKKNAIAKVENNKPQLLQRGSAQLEHNLNGIFVLARNLGYQIEYPKQTIKP